MVASRHVVKDITKVSVVSILARSCRGVKLIAPGLGAQNVKIQREDLISSSDLSCESYSTVPGWLSAPEVGWGLLSSLLLWQVVVFNAKHSINSLPTIYDLPLFGFIKMQPLFKIHPVLMQLGSDQQHLAAHFSFKSFFLFLQVCPDYFSSAGLGGGGRRVDLCLQSLDLRAWWSRHAPNWDICRIIYGW